MDRSTKNTQIEEFHEKFGKAQAAFLTGYSGIEVGSMTEIRKALRDSSVELRVLRNTLAKLAIKDTPYEGLAEHFKGPIAVALSYSDAASAAKTLTKYAKDEPNFKLIVGALGEKVLTTDEIKALSELPSKDELIAKLVGLLNNIPASFVGVLSALPRDLVYALSAIRDKKEAEGN
ncbi:MAG: 50S ribosomal protein L10 [Deltaproteobacteria bacterium]|nr:50S ribosomal protein L10 [Deltaproteobacteria bacterium]